MAYCDPTDVGSMVGQVRRVLDDDDLWSRLQAAGLEQAAGYSWRAQALSVMQRVSAS